MVSVNGERETTVLSPAGPVFFHTLPAAEVVHLPLEFETLRLAYRNVHAAAGISYQFLTVRRRGISGILPPHPAFRGKYLLCEPVYQIEDYDCKN